MLSMNILLVVSAFLVTTSAAAQDQNPSYDIVCLPSASTNDAPIKLTAVNDDGSTPTNALVIDLAQARKQISKLATKREYDLPGGKIRVSLTLRYVIEDQSKGDPARFEIQPTFYEKSRYGWSLKASASQMKFNLPTPTETLMGNFNSESPVIPTLQFKCNLRRQTTDSNQNQEICQPKG